MGRQSERLAQPLMRRCFALPYRVYCLRLYASFRPQTYGLPGCVSRSKLGVETGAWWLPVQPLLFRMP